MKVVLAYSGGLDTSVIVPWLRENYDAEVICFAADIGQGPELEGLGARALASGAADFVQLDLRREFIEGFVLPTVRAGAVYGRKYLLGTSMARPLIAAHQVRVAREVGADAVAHGCTGKGNDQVRFELTYAALAPDLRVIAPWREWTIRSREDALAYASARGLRVPVSSEKLFSRDRNLWHVSHEGGPLEDPAWEPDESLFLLTASPERAPDVPEYVTIDFSCGYPTAVNGERAEPLVVLERLNAIGGRHGVGRVDLVEDRLVGMKSRGVYETPGGTILHNALRELEQLALDRRALALKDQLGARYADLVYEGRWWGGEREALDALVDSLERRVSGRIRFKLFKGNLEVAGRWSENSLYDEGLATFGAGGSYNQSDAQGFIRLFSLPYVGVAADLVPSEPAAQASLFGPSVNGRPAQAAEVSPAAEIETTPRPNMVATPAPNVEVTLGPDMEATPAATVNETPATGGRDGRMWGGRFESEPAEEFERVNRSLPVDARLWREDIRGSRAWTRGLRAAGVLAADEEAGLLEGLDRVAGRMPEVLASDPPDEDIHSLVERLLYEELGALAGKLHTGRSRNDQVATDSRLWAMRACRDLGGLIARLERALLAQAEKSTDLLMPGYTHLRRAQPLRAGHWLLSHFWKLERDRERLALAAERASVLPLGSGALAGCPFPVDRDYLRDQLGFRALSENSLDAVSDRDWACEIVFALALLGVHLSGLAEDLILFSSAEFGFVELDERVTSGSSLMPQKRNPDALELARGKSAGLIGDLTAILTLLKALPSGYNKDLQEDKAILFRAVDATLAVVPALALTVETLRLNGERMAAALDESMLATDLADRLVAHGVPFRETHAVVGGLVKEAERQGVSLSALPEESLAPLGLAEGEGNERERTFSFSASADRRESAGGTGRRALAEQIRLARAQLATPGSRS
jgi:argininosuccinate lyase/argininosuccinate synthase